MTSQQTKPKHLRRWILGAALAMTSLLVNAQNTPNAPNTPNTTDITRDLVLSITQVCKPMPRGGRCALSFVQTLRGQAPIGDVTQSCAPGWLAHITASRGSVEKGGINRSQAVVCGHIDPKAAIRALLIACDTQSLGICQDANDIDIRWAFWSPSETAMQALPRNQVLAIEQLPQAARCQTPVPLIESSTCSAQSAVLLRQSGLR
jgi:hypothetical protein